MFANCQLMGMDLAFPDVCKTPVPVPFPNVALGPMAIPNVPNILLMAMPAHNLGTVTPITLGDQPGVLGGIISQTFMQQSRHITGAFTVLTKALPTTRVTSVSLQNRMNIVGMRLIPSQFKVLVLAP
ncbi:DUF4150 domain-containing protein [Variovorax paradoxus]|jgi:hypothetical protein|uniref:DUF4150 domain-containing protein n=1 Tax=Variovorax paradoxus TaxID=34073 RepID=UPI0033962E35